MICGSQRTTIKAKHRAIESEKMENGKMDAAERGHTPEQHELVPVSTSKSPATDVPESNNEKNPTFLLQSTLPSFQRRLHLRLRIVKRQMKPL